MSNVKRVENGTEELADEIEVERHINKVVEQTIRLDLRPRRGDDGIMAPITMHGLRYVLKAVYLSRKEK